jgi:transcription elongation factor GreA-like protein
VKILDYNYEHTNDNDKVCHFGRRLMRFVKSTILDKEHVWERVSTCVPKKFEFFFFAKI